MVSGAAHAHPAATSDRDQAAAATPAQLRLGATPTAKLIGIGTVTLLLGLPITKFDATQRAWQPVRMHAALATVKAPA